MVDMETRRCYGEVSAQQDGDFAAAESTNSSI